MAPLRFLDTPGARIAWREDNPQAPGPAVLWLAGFRSDMAGTKTEALAAWARETGARFVRFDYRGCGASTGAFVDGTISRWRDDALAMARGPLAGAALILVGSSMGAWIATLVARELGARARGLGLIAPALDFTERLMRPALDARTLARIEREGYAEIPASEPGYAPTLITRALLEDGRKRQTMDDLAWLQAPVRVLQGMRDDAVPWTEATELIQRVPHADARLTLAPHGDHRLSDPARLRDVVSLVAALYAEIRDA